MKVPDGVEELVYTVVVAVTVTVWAVHGGQPVEEEVGEEVEEELWLCGVSGLERFGLGSGGLGSTLRWATWTAWSCLCWGGGLATGDAVR